MNSRLTPIAGAALATLALASCGDSDPEDSVRVPPAGIDIAASKSSLGTIVVDGKGMTAYVFDEDAAGSGTSACAGECAKVWPAITSASDAPKVEGVTGKVGTITGADGAMQITLEGLPLYTYADDSEVGDGKGQGKDGTWWVVSPAGDKITMTADTGGGGRY